MSEDKIQAQIFQWYHNTYCTKLNDLPHLIFSVPNGGTRTKVEAMKFKATGLLAGVSDLIIVRPDEVIFLEVKTSTGTQSKVQKEFQKKVEAMGYKYLLVRSLEECQNQLNK